MKTSILCLAGVPRIPACLAIICILAEMPLPCSFSNSLYNDAATDLKSQEKPEEKSAAAVSSETAEPQSSESRTDSNYRMLKLREWRTAVAQHAPGKPDHAAVAVAEWQPGDLEMVISLLTTWASQPTKSVRRTIAKASIRRVLQLTDQEAQNGDLTRVLKLGALLHTDIDLLELEPGIYQATMTGLNGIGMFADGKVIPQPQRFHWELARRLLAPLSPQDPLLRQWCVATTAHMQSRRLLGYAGQNLKYALEKLPADAKILFYAGVLHEVWASPVNQNPQLPPGVKLTFGSKDSELKLARQCFQKALAEKADSPEVHLHLGRVLGLLGEHKLAIKELQLAADAIRDPQLQYYASLFLGREMAVTAHSNEALALYERASALYPTAQSPLLALSQIKYSGGDSKSALSAILRVFALPRKDRWKDDPWWEYDLAHVRDAASLVLDMIEVFGRLRR